MSGWCCFKSSRFQSSLLVTDNQKRPCPSHSVPGNLNLAPSAEPPPIGELGGVWYGGVLGQLFSRKLGRGGEPHTGWPDPVTMQGDSWLRQLRNNCSGPNE